MAPCRESELEPAGEQVGITRIAWAPEAASERPPETYEPAAYFEDPLAGRECQEAYAALLRCLTGLEPKIREMVLRAYYRGASRQALAVKFNTPVGTVKTWLRRSLAQLKDCLSS